MALLDFLLENAESYALTVTALNCEHGIRGEKSKRDSEFVKNYCASRGVPLKIYSADCIALAEEHGESVETAARNWRRECYADAAEHFGAVIATAHHLNDNAETVLFNLARGSGLSGLAGIADGKVKCGDGQCRIIRPLIGCSRAEIDDYIVARGIPFVEDETNGSDAYTRNYIRMNVLPQLEKAVPGAAENIYRFSRIAAEDDEFLTRIATAEYLDCDDGFALIKHCVEKPLFSRAALAAIAGKFAKKDYTAAHVEALYNLQFLEVGKAFEFLGLTAYKEEGRIAISGKRKKIENVIPFGVYENPVDLGITFSICKCNENDENPRLIFDLDKVPQSAVVRTRRDGDRFTKFGGGTKSLGDFMTDRKIPMRLRDFLPVIAVGNEILAIIGVEISEKIKIDEGTKNKYAIISSRY